MTLRGDKLDYDGDLSSPDVSILNTKKFLNSVILDVHEGPGVSRHETWKTTFVLCVDSFCIKYHNKDDLDHLLNMLRMKYTISTDRTGSNYIRLTIDYNYSKGHVEISMPEYTDKILQKILHMPPTQKQYAPHKWTKQMCEQILQYALPE